MRYSNSDPRKEAIKECISEDKEFAWKWRIVDSATSKLPMLFDTDPKKAKSLARRIRHLEKYCEEAIQEELKAMAECEEERRDPYGSRGLSRSMFM